LQAAFARADLEVEQLRLPYLGLDGPAGVSQLDAYCNGAPPLPPLQCDMAAYAIDERLDEVSGGRRCTRDSPDASPARAG
jgi:hypothetical protein